MARVVGGRKPSPGLATGNTEPAVPRASPGRKVAGQEGGVALSPREAEVVGCITRGLKYNEIAEELGLSFETVKTYAARIRRKLGLRSKTEVAVWAVRSNGR